MSSSNRVKVTFIPETVYGETPAAGDFETARFTSESLSGTPETTESQQIRTDRMSSGQVVTGLTVGGDLNFELAKEDSLDQLIESAMYNTWAVSAPVAVDLTVDIVAGDITRAAGDFNNDVAVGDILKLSGFTNTENNTQVMVVEIVSATEIRYVGKDLVDEVGTGTSFEVSDKIEIGVTKKSFSMQKEFEDLNQKAIIYKGQIANTMSFNVAYGEIITGTFGFNGNAQDAVEASGDFITDSRTVNPAATSNSMNGSVDMPYLVLSDGSVIDEATFCIQSVEISLNNNLTPQTCIGKAAPQDYSEGTAQVEVTMNAYLADQNWSLLAKKLSQEPIAFGFQVKNDDGYYGFYLPAVQLSFDDPASGGQNQDVVLSMSGVAKVGANQEKSLTMYRS